MLQDKVENLKVFLWDKLDSTFSSGRFLFKTLNGCHLTADF
ncbi:hypothetical protein LX77_00308 [Gelidibacter algens]|uniref:Uncharacterized protein n=1 Tax=Gelidibacter algens TaxID=49280 RepID=A0A327SII9_9FLAO|nr:hypothetical protein LX77_00308 [Gelidibacter algens]